MVSTKYDREYIGLICGFLATALGFLLYGLAYTTFIRPNVDLGSYVTELFWNTKENRSKILSLSMVCVVPVFFLFNRWNMFRVMKGILISMFIMGMIIVVLWL